MTIYWLLLAYPAVLAFLFPDVNGRYGVRLGQALALGAFVILYTALSYLRFEVGADWYAYEAMYQSAAFAPIEEAASVTDPLFSVLLWVSAQAGLGLNFPNAVCSLLLATGLVSVSVQLRQPWLAVVSAVPYLLIVVGFGYVRQAGAIGLILMALAAVGNAKTGRALVYLALAAGFHSTAAGVFPFFGLAIANRNRLRVFLLASIGSLGMMFFLSRQLATLETTYIDTDYQSGGALVRISLSAIASAFILLRWKTIDCPARSRSIWIGFAVANFVALALLFALEFSTAVDRVSLYFSVVQLLFFASFAQFLGLGKKMAVFGRMAVVAIAVAVQLVWLVYATHADSWVPYKTVLG